MPLRLGNLESGRLTTPLTTENLQYQGALNPTPPYAPNPALSSPSYNSWIGANVVHGTGGGLTLNSTDSLTVAVAKLGALYTNRYGDSIYGTMAWTNGSAATFATGSSASFNGTSTLNFNDTASCIFNTGTATYWRSGSSATFQSGSSLNCAAATFKLGGAGAGVATVQNGNNAANTVFNFPVKVAGTYTIATTAEIPDLSHVTYDNVAETISSVWDFTAGAQLEQIRIEDNDIFERDTNGDNGTIYLNRIGHNGTTDHFRNTILGDGKGTYLFEADGTTSCVISKTNFYTDDSNVLADGADLSGATIELDRQVTPHSLAKAWVSVDFDLSGPTVTKVDYYNVDTVTIPNTNQLQINWLNAFANDDYVVQIQVEGVFIIGGYEFVTTGHVLSKTTANCVIAFMIHRVMGEFHIFGLSYFGAGRTVRINVTAHGDLA